MLAATLSPSYGIYSGLREPARACPVRAGQRGVPRLGEVRAQGARARRAAAAARRDAERDPARAPGAPAPRRRHVPRDGERARCSPTPSRTGDDAVLVVVNLDPGHAHEGRRRRPARRSACPPRSTVADLLDGATLRRWHDGRQLRAARCPASARRTSWSEREPQRLGSALGASGARRSPRDHHDPHRVLGAHPGAERRRRARVPARAPQAVRVVPTRGEPRRAGAHRPGGPVRGVSCRGASCRCDYRLEVICARTGTTCDVRRPVLVPADARRARPAPDRARAGTSSSGTGSARTGASSTARRHRVRGLGAGGALA